MPKIDLVLRYDEEGTRGMSRSSGRSTCTKLACLEGELVTAPYARSKSDFPLETEERKYALHSNPAHSTLPPIPLPLRDTK